MMNEQLLADVRSAVDAFVPWLERYGETSQDHQDFYASRVGRAAKSLYYRNKMAGTLAVLPMVACEAFVPWTRRFFYPRMRLPIADAHYAMGFALLYRATDRREHYARALHFLDVLEQTRCPAYSDYAWGYPFDWQTRHGVFKAGTPLITTTPYCYEAFEYVWRIDANPRWQAILRSTAQHVLRDYDDVPAGPNAATCTYFPHEEPGVVNASAYRAFVLASAHREFSEDRFWAAAEKNVNFVLQCQNSDGSWPYAMDGVRDFVDHFHTCFVLKGLAKIERLTGHEGCRRAIDRGVAYYLENLFAEDGLPKPFAKAPRMTVYKRELYDCAECLNLGMLLAGRYPALDAAVERLVRHLLQAWRKRDGSFRSRKLMLGYDNVPMHRWGQSELFRSLCLILAKAAGHDPLPLNDEANYVRNLRDL
ncbi:MAG TPA: hypothetical protein VHE61_10135 [Opitutaceae bacterium]|nr:hypothetical protein [Opitutaceae bacterium]